jgi:AraC family transcriptional regulator, transcriptional activator of pobA
MNQFFHIFKISYEDAKKIETSPDSVHNHDFEELIVGIDGIKENKN